MSGRFVTGSGRPAGAALRGLPAAVRRAGQPELEATALLLVRQLQIETNTPGRGKIRRHTVASKGAGSFTRVTTADGRRVRKLRRKGVRLTDLTKATRASAPGDPPAPDRGAYKGSFGMAPITSNGRPGVRVGTGARQAKALEEGTTTAGRKRNVTILPRPHFVPALAKVRAAMAARMGGGLRTRVAASLRSKDAGGA